MVILGLVVNVNLSVSIKTHFRSKWIHMQNRIQTFSTFCSGWATWCRGGLVALTTIMEEKLTLKLHPSGRSLTCRWQTRALSPQHLCAAGSLSCMLSGSLLLPPPPVFSAGCCWLVHSTPVGNINHLWGFGFTFYLYTVRYAATWPASLLCIVNAWLRQ